MNNLTQESASKSMEINSMVRKCKEKDDKNKNELVFLYCRQKETEFLIMEKLEREEDKCSLCIEP
jgi:hypothetical protein